MADYSGTIDVPADVYDGWTWWCIAHDLVLPPATVKNIHTRGYIAEIRMSILDIVVILGTRLRLIPSYLHFLNMGK